MLVPVQRQHVTKETRTRARRLRRELTPAEKKLWPHLRDHQMFGVNFRRQYPIEPFIVDFYCPACKLVVEIDGDTHADLQPRDAARTAKLEEIGCRVVRFTNSDVHENLAGVLDAILQAVQQTAPAP